MSNSTERKVAIVGGARTPFAKAGAQLKGYSALELATHSVDGALELTGLDPEQVDELAYGTVIVDPAVPHLAREVNFRSRLPADVRSLTLTDNCITGTSAIQSVYNSIVLGRADVGIAGGVDSMSNPPVMFTPEASRIFLDASRAKTLRDRLKVFSKLRPRHLKPWSYGIAEPSTGLTMGEHTEITVKEWGISREEQDEIAWRSHRNAHAATEDGRLKAEISPLGGFDRDLLIRPDTTLEALSRLRPVFDRSEKGTLTAGNSSPLTDGAAATVLMAEERARELGFEPLAFIRDFINVGISPDDGLLMGPGIAVPRLLERNGLSIDDIDIFEMHEAFAGQVASNLKAWEQGWKEPAIGRVDRERLNPLGSSIAVGHPFAATGARIATTLANELARRDARYGIISICGAGATAVAMLLERA
ncbi:acetyl-CoA C-acyltransferase [Elongatibacter sediminis]|uniref:Acetyl-CoA C-acyltransferase n=1 Tax=Elongatibacter sediminis TaxID=3119006 RepID=A0AAW9RG05_9GAMM